MEEMVEESHKNDAVFLKLILGSETVTNDNTQGWTNQDEEQQLADDDTRLVNHAGDGHIKLRFLTWVLPKKCNKYKKSKYSKKFPTSHILFYLTTSNCIVISIHMQLLPLWFGHFVFKTTFSVCTELLHSSLPGGNRKLPNYPFLACKRLQMYRFLKT